MRTVRRLISAAAHAASRLAAAVRLPERPQPPCKQHPGGEE